ncbi:MAG TPA: hypothetical protein P5511_01845, partial [Candidatus Goldiibacteriota bacterium]|nr:hypothetical protein [Candidatus Goldiibacteriota bacterium]
MKKIIIFLIIIAAAFSLYFLKPVDIKNSGEPGLNDAKDTTPGNTAEVRLFYVSAEGELEEAKAKTVRHQAVTENIRQVLAL